jgi:MscS family membrane protein
MEQLRKLFNYPLYGQDTVAELSWCIGILLIGLLLKRLLTRLLTHFLFQILKRYSGEDVGYDKLHVLVKKPLGYLVLLLTLYFAADCLSFPNEWHLASDDHFGLRMILQRSFHLLLIASLSFIILRIVDFFGLVLKYRSSLADTKDDQLVPFIKEAIKVLIIILSMFTILGSVFRINVASLIAGLGIGGLAVALAAKESIENLLGSFTIFLDKPFMVGDYVKISSFEGTVESIGFRSTRIRTVEKTLVTVPNKKMVDAELDNISRRTHRRIRFTFGLEGGSTSAQIRTITKGIKDFMEKDERILPDTRQVSLLELGTNSVNMLVLCYMESPDYSDYLHLQEDLNYVILDLMEHNKVTFSSPITGFGGHR